MAEPQANTVPLAQGGKIYNVPSQDVQARLSEGWQQVSAEELEAYDRKKEYEATHTPLQQIAEGVAVGAAAGVLSAPALVTKLATGREHSGHSWTAKIASGLSDDSAEEIEKELRTIADVSPVAHGAGSLAGSLAGSGGAAAAGKFALKKAAAAGGSLAAAAETAIVEGGLGVKAAIVGESALSSTAMMNEEMFVQNRELTAEMMAMSAALGGAGPLVAFGVGAGVRKAGSKIAGKIDDVRMGRHQEALSRHADEVADIEARYADDVAARDSRVAEIDAEFAGKMKRHKAKVDELDIKYVDALKSRDKKLIKSTRQKLKQAKKNYEYDISRMVKKEADAVAELRYQEKLLKKGAKDKAAVMRKRDEAVKKEMGKWEGTSFPKSLYSTREDWIKSLKRDMDLKYPFKESSAKRPKIKGSELERIEADIRKRHPYKVGDVSPDPVPMPRRGMDPEMPKRKAYPDEVTAPDIPSAPEMPFAFKRLFDGSKRERLGAAAEFMKRSESTFMDWAKAHGGDLGKGVKMGADAASRAARPTSYRGSRAVQGAFLGALTGDFLGAVAGGVGGKIVEKYGPVAAGAMFKQMSHAVGAVARQATKNLDSAVVHKPALLSSAATRVRAKEYTKTAFEDVTAQVDAASANPAEFANQIGDTFGEFNNADPGMVPAVTNHYLGAIQYLKAAQPTRRPLNPSMPQLGLTSISQSEKERYLRKARAVMNPLSLLEDMSNGRMSRDAAEAVRTVYPSLYFTMQSEALAELSQREKPLARKAAMVMDQFLGGQGLAYAASTPAYMHRLDQINQMSKQMGGTGGPGPRQGTQNRGRPTGSPTMTQQMKTNSQRASESIGN